MDSVFTTYIGIDLLRVLLGVQAAHLPQAYILCSIRAIISQTYGNV